MPGIPKDNNNNGTNKTTNKPTMLPPSSQRTELNPLHLLSDTPHISRQEMPPPPRAAPLSTLHTLLST